MKSPELDGLAPDSLNYEVNVAKKVTGEIVGGKSEVMNDVDTVSDVAEKLGLGASASGYTAAINGDTAELDESLEDFQNVTFAPASKGGAQ